ncbi:hypothetical protein [Kistimonas asteriae]|uniref:hypothetical protein n=1 Tax=Kistimonas asteriae TaxID=517724 RepID=UPI001BAA6428|nr:hypothetical protein [Kistimonas asteriae]
MSGNNPTEKNTADLLGELETLKDFLGTSSLHGDQADNVSDETNTDEIPILFDIAMDDGEEDDIPLLLDQVDNTTEMPDDTQQLSTQLRPDQVKATLEQAGELLIQEIIDEEMVRIEAILRRQLKAKLNQLLNSEKN